MTDHLPYEENLLRQLAELPLPDVNAAWVDMRRRLEEDDDDRAVPFWRRRGCVLWGLLLVVVIGIGWWWSRSSGWMTTRQTEKQKVSEPLYSNPGTKQNRSDTINRSRTIEGLIDTPGQKNFSTGITSDEITGNSGSFGEDANVLAKTRNGRKNGDKETERIIIKTIPGKRSTDTQKNKTIPSKETSLSTQKDDQRPLPKPDTATIIKREIKTAPGLPDTSQLKTIDTARQTKKPVPTDSTGKEKSKKKDPAAVPNFFSTGIGLHQQLPVNGQTFTPYNASGRKGTLADYIPSVYFRFHHGDRWFLQTGFRYGAPQYNKEFAYEITKDFATNTDTVQVLKKTYYHQLPLTFHYKLLPGLTLGAGIVWNRFSSAVSREQIIKPRTAPTGQDTLLSETIVKARPNDSVFSKSYFQATTELQYKWKRFSIGAAYSFGLQPYIQFTLPGGTHQKERNSSLQVFLRYELWKSQKK